MNGYERMMKRFNLPSTMEVCDRNEMKESSSLFLEQQMKESPSYEGEFFYYSQDEEYETNIDILIYNKKTTTSYGDTVDFQTTVSKAITLGKTLYDRKHDEYWICIQSHNKNDVFVTGKLAKCCYFLKWQDEKANIHMYPFCYRNASQYNNGEDTGNVFILGNDQLIGFIECNENTLALERGHRFFIDNSIKKHTVYTLTRLDNITNTDRGIGYCSLILSEDTYDKNRDSLEKWICDYREVSNGGNNNDDDTNDDDSKDTLNEYTCSITPVNINYLESGSTYRKFSIKITKNGENVVSLSELQNANYLWQIECEETVREKLKIQNSADGSYINISVNDKSLVGKTFTLRLNVTCDDFTCTTTKDIVIKRMF